MAGRQDNHGPKINKEFEAVYQRLTGVNAQLAGIAGQMNNMQRGNSLTSPEPDLPFKKAERITDDGIMVLVRANVPSSSEQIRTFTLPVSKNKQLEGETLEEAKKRAFDQATGDRFSFITQIDEAHQAAGFIEYEIGPFKPKPNDPDSFKIQLLRLVVTDDAGAKTKNPVDSPFQSDMFPYPALIVNEMDDPMTMGDDRYFFTIGDLINNVPSKPSLADIKCNIPNFATPAPDALVTVEVRASDTDPNKSFVDVGGNAAKAVFLMVNDPAIPSMPTEGTDAPIVLSEILSDPTVKSVRLQGIFPFGKEFQWKRNVVFNTANTGIAKNVAVDIKFFPGGSQGFGQLVAAYTAQTGSSMDGKIKVVVNRVEGSNTSSEAVLYLTQPAAGMTPCDPAGQPALVKRAIFYIQRANGQWRKLGGIGLVKDETNYKPGEHLVPFQFNHRANRTDINIKVELYSVGDDPAPMIFATSMGNGSMLDAVPIDPIAADITTAPDGSTDDIDAYVDVKIWTSIEARNGQAGAPTFADKGIEQVFFAMKRLKSTSMTSDVDEPDTRFQQYGGPVPDEDKNSTSTVIRVKGLRSGKKYRVRRTIFVGGGSTVKSPGTTPVDFRAGFGTLSIAGLIIVGVNAMFIDSQKTRLLFTIDQPIAPALPVALRKAELFVGAPYEAGFISGNKSTFGPADRLKDLTDPEYSDNTTGSPPITDAVLKHRKIIKINFDHRKNTTGLQYYLRITARGGETLESVVFNLADTGGDQPGFPGVTVPAVPIAADIQTNQLLEGQVSFIFRCYATDLRLTPFPALGRPLTYLDVNADGCGLAIRKVGQTGDPLRPLASVDQAQGFFDLAVTGLEFGQQYTIAKEFAFKGLTGAKQDASLNFVAGGSIDLAGISVALAVIDMGDDTRITKAAITISQNAATVVIFPRIKIMRQVIGRDASPKEVGERIDATNFPDLFSGTGVRPAIELDLKHPANKSSVFFVRVIAYGSGGAVFKDSNTITINAGSDASPPPTVPPSAPSLALLATSVADGDVITNVTVSTSNGQSFAQVGADKVIAKFRRTSNSVPQQFINELDDAERTQTSVTVECPGLREGKQYEWTANLLASSNPVKTKAVSASPVLFNAGNTGGSIFTILSFQITSIDNFDDRNSIANGQFVMPNPSVQLTSIVAQRRQSVIPGDVFKRQSAIDPTKEKDPNGVSYNTPGFHSFQLPISHKPKPTSGENMVTVRIKLEATGNQTLFSPEFTFNVGGIDAGIPQWILVQPIVKARWRPNVLRCSFNRPDGNMRSFVTNKMALYFQCNDGTEFIWNPTLDPGADFQQSFTGIQGYLQNFVASTFLISLGGQTIATFERERPTFGSPGDAGGLPTTIFNKLNTVGGTMVVFAFVQNEFNTSSVVNSIGSIAVSIFPPFTA